MYSLVLKVMNQYSLRDMDMDLLVSLGMLFMSIRMNTENRTFMDSM